jgi:transcriptional regulator with XRE-family HTH domain
MKPVYQVKAWQDNDWWLAQVVSASEDADLKPINALTQAKNLNKIEHMARDLIATILDKTQDAFELKIDYILPDDIDSVVRDANSARAWLESAQEMWQERSALAAQSLTEHGFSLRETARLLGISHQRVDQILTEKRAVQSRGAWAVEVKGHSLTGSFAESTETDSTYDVDLVVVITDTVDKPSLWLAHSEEVRARTEELGERIAATLANFKQELSDRAAS